MRRYILRGYKPDGTTLFRIARGRAAANLAWAWMLDQGCLVVHRDGGRP